MNLTSHPATNSAVGKSLKKVEGTGSVAVERRSIPPNTSTEVREIVTAEVRGSPKKSVGRVYSESSWSNVKYR